MDPLCAVLQVFPYSFLRPPKLRLKLPSFSYPSPLLVFAGALFTYFLVVSGIVFDVINEPPGIGSRLDEATGKYLPQVFMAGSVHRQYIIEGLASGFLFSLGGIGVIMVQAALGTRGKQPKNVRLTLLGAGFAFVVVSYSMSIVFLRIKLPGYLS